MPKNNKSIFGIDQIPCNGKVIILHLDQARRLLTSLRFEEVEQQTAAEEQAQNIELTIIEVATLCSGAEFWEQLHSYLQEAGIEVTQEFCYRKMHLDRIMEETPADANRN